MLQCSCSTELGIVSILSIERNNWITHSDKGVPTITMWGWVDFSCQHYFCSSVFVKVNRLRPKCVCCCSASYAATLLDEYMRAASISHKLASVTCYLASVIRLQLLSGLNHLNSRQEEKIDQNELTAWTHNFLGNLPSSARDCVRWVVWSLCFDSDLTFE